MKKNIEVNAMFLLFKENVCIFRTLSGLILNTYERVSAASGLGEFNCCSLTAKPVVVSLCFAHGRRHTRKQNNKN